jgi:hypothetical protein
VHPGRAAPVVYRRGNIAQTSGETQNGHYMKPSLRRISARDLELANAAEKPVDDCCLQPDAAPHNSDPDSDHVGTGVPPSMTKRQTNGCCVQPDPVPHNSDPDSDHVATGNHSSS